MEQFAKETLPVSLEAEMRHSYLDYAMSVIVGAPCRTSATA
jgi:DNA gyrase subunit A